VADEEADGAAVDSAPSYLTYGSTSTSTKDEKNLIQGIFMSVFFGTGLHAEGPQFYLSQNFLHYISWTLI